MALVTTLIILVIITTIAVGLMTMTRLERVATRSSFNSLQARIMVTMGADQAVALIQEATEAGSQSGKFWSSQPGKITVFNADGTVDSNASVDLFSQSSTSAAQLVDLNQATFGGLHPIASAESVGQTVAPKIEVGWINVLEDPSAPAGPNNSVVGRYAFWVDDETTKINVNTADGLQKYQGNWFGSGTPPDVALSVLTNDGQFLAKSEVEAITAQSGIRHMPGVTARSYNEERELQSVAGVSDIFADANNFNLTAYNLAPELNLFGEPRIYLTTSITPAGAHPGQINDALLGVYNYTGIGNPGDPTRPVGKPLTQIYPSSAQLPSFQPAGVSLPQTFDYEEGMNNQSFSILSSDYHMGLRIARYLKGYNSLGSGIEWPVFPGSGTDGFAGKYTDRQIDSIALQILSLMKRGTLGDHWRTSSLPYIMGRGWLSGKPVRGIGRAPRLTEIVMEFRTTPNTVNGYAAGINLNVRTYLEWYLPIGFKGYPLTTPYDATSSMGFRIGMTNNRSYLNMTDAANFTGSGGVFGSFWMDQMLKIEDQTGSPAGIDLFGNRYGQPDPDQTKAASYHPWTLRTTGTHAGKYMGTGPVNSLDIPALYMNPSLSPNGWQLGDYHCVSTHPRAFYAQYPSKPDVTELRIKGGITVWAKTSSGNPDNGYNLDPVPLDSVRGPNFTEEAYSGIQNELLEAVIPFPEGIVLGPTDKVVVHFQVADPLVNSMPGDWVATINPPESQITLQRPPDPAGTSEQPPSVYQDGLNTISSASEGGDAKSIWWPEQSATIAKRQRFPSSGYLQYIRTGMMPDKAIESLPLASQHGTPYRSLNFAPSTHPSQQTEGGDSYPDWAMLDLFTVPASLQHLNADEYLNLTTGGATAGRLNPNPPLLPAGSLARHTPLQGMLTDLQVFTEQSDEPTSQEVDWQAVSAAVEQYIHDTGRPLMLAGEISNVPEVANYLYNGADQQSRSRNDLVRQIVGNLTTRSNTFSVWSIGQVVKKQPGNSQYGEVESGDTIVGESRMRFLVERYIDLGADGVVGNASNPGPDGIVGTPDDPTDPELHPALSYPLPYRYRVVGVKEFAH